MALTLEDFTRSAEALFTAHDQRLISGRRVIVTISEMAAQQRLASEILEETGGEHLGYDTLKLLEHLRRAEKAGSL